MRPGPSVSVLHSTERAELLVTCPDVSRAAATLARTVPPTACAMRYARRRRPLAVPSRCSPQVLPRVPVPRAPAVFV